jgi:hypothetical protein
LIREKGKEEKRSTFFVLKTPKTVCTQTVFCLIQTVLWKIYTNKQLFYGHHQ